MGFLCFEIDHVRLFIVEKMEFGMAPRRCRICFKPQPLLQKTCLSYASETLATCSGLRTQATTHVHRPRATLVKLFPKIDFCSLKRLYFPF